jgi:hypothetical protein
MFLETDNKKIYDNTSNKKLAQENRIMSMGGLFVGGVAVGGVSDVL